MSSDFEALTPEDVCKAYKALQHIINNLAEIEDCDAPEYALGVQYALQHAQVRLIDIMQIIEPCSECDSAGRIYKKSDMFIVCPSCNGRGTERQM